MEKEIGNNGLIWLHLISKVPGKMFLGVFQLAMKEVESFTHLGSLNTKIVMLTCKAASIRRALNKFLKVLL
jgi:hypothetical protein